MADQTVPSAVVADENASARRNTVILALASAVNGANGPITVTLGGLAGLYLLGADKSLATLPVSGFTIGIALGALPAAILMRRVGRRLGFMGGSVVGMIGGATAAVAIFIASFPLLVLGFAFVGFAAAFVQQYRFAAADTGTPEFRAKAISWVLIGGVATAIIGPQTVIFTRDLFAPIPFAGSFVAMIVLSFLGLLLLTLLGGQARTVPALSSESGGRSLGEIARQPRFVVAIVCAIGSYALMTLVMTAAPLAMVACGLGEDNAALGIQWHVLAMFAPSFFTGSLIARYGPEPIIAIGLALLTGCAAVALSGIDIVHFWSALILLGLGWNFGFVGATTMLTTTYRSEERGKVQGLNDFLVFGSVAFASLSSGKLLSSVGWDWVVLVVFPVVAICLLALIAGVLLKRRQAAWSR